MAARHTWRGSVNVRFAGSPLPIPVSIAVYARHSDRRSGSFKMLDPKYKQPISQQLVDRDGIVVQRSATLKGVEAAPGDFRALEGQALEMIANVGRSETVEVERWPLVESVPFDDALDTYAVVPDPKVPGAEDAVQVLWNGLRGSGRAAVIAGWAAKENSRPSTLVIRATDEGLIGSLIAFASELKSDLPAFTPQVNEQVGQMFEKGIREYSLEDYDPAAYTDTYSERRQQAIDLALSGKPLPVDDQAPAAPTETPKLMDALVASLAAMGEEPAPEPKPARKATRKKVTA